MNVPSSPDGHGYLRALGRWCDALATLIVVWTLLLSPLAAQKLTSQFTHTAWSPQSGIPVPIRAIVQTPDGYLWLGTESGLYRFDGIRFEAWARERLLSDAVHALFVAADGRLWIGYGSGGVGVIANNHLRNFSAGKGVPEGAVLSIVEGRDRTIWVSAQYGFSRYANGEWKHVGDDMGYPAPAAQSLLVDRQGNLWVATDGKNFGLSRDPVRRNTILRLAAGSKQFASTGLGVGQVWSIVQSDEGNVWIADSTGDTLRRITGPRRGIRVIAVPRPTSVVLDRSHAFWAGSNGRVWRCPIPSSGDAISATDQFSPRDGLSGGFVYTTLRDREGNLWFGTSGGLDRFRENKVVSFSAREGVVPDRMMAISPTADGSLWAMGYTSDRLWRIPDQSLYGGTIRAQRRSVVGDILSIFTEGQNSVWLGGYSQLAMGKNGAFSLLQLPPAAKDGYIEAVTRDLDSRLWIALWNKQDQEHIFRYQNGRWTDLSETFGLPKFRCRVMYSDSQGRTWLGFENGDVVVFDGDTYRRYSTLDGLPPHPALVIASDGRGGVWIGSSGGLSQFENGRFQTITKESGLPGNSVSGILDEGNGTLWIVGALGILRVRRDEVAKAFRHSSYPMQGEFFDASDGLRGLPRQREPFPTAARTVNGWLWFATTEGISAVDPRHIPRNTLPPPVVIESIRSDDGMSIAEPGMHFRSNTRNLEFKFTALSFTDPSRVRFRYKLDGYEKGWREPMSAREIRYTNLPPGKYVFHVLACNNDGVWNEEGARLDFSIDPAYYQTNWFRLLCIVSVIGLLWIMYRIRLRVLRQRQFLLERNQELLEKHHDEITALNERLVTAQEEERSRISEELHDGVLQELAAACIKLGAIENPGMSHSDRRLKIDDLQERLIGVGSDIRRLSHGLHPPALHGEGLPEALMTYCREFADLHKLEVSCTADACGRDLPAAAALSLYRIAQEALGNVAKHSGASQVEVRLVCQDGFVVLRIQDNGRGFLAEESGMSGGLGLISMRERVRLLRGSIELRSEPGLGTTVRIEIPAPTKS